MRTRRPAYVPMDEEAMKGVVGVGEVHAQHRLKVVTVRVP